MDQKHFVDILKEIVIEDSVISIQSNLFNPPGQKPSQSLLEASDFYKRLNDAEKIVFLKIVRDSVRTGVWGFLCVLDGVRAIEENEKGQLNLTYKKKGVETKLNNDSEGFLHELL